MASPHHLFLTALLLTIFTNSIPAHTQQTCKTQKFTNNNLFTNCIDLPKLDSYLHYTYDSKNSTLSIAFIASPAKPNGWISWAVNPTGSGMVGAQSLIAFKNPEGMVTVKTFDLKSYTDINEGKLSVEVWDVKGESENGVMRIFGKVKVEEKMMMGKSINHVWQVGPSVVAGFPARHDFSGPNMLSKGTLNLVTGTTVTDFSGDETRLNKKNIHGILNAVSWGILFPLGAVIARYVRVFESADPAWFYAHVSCQCAGYVLGVAGWGTGLKLGSESKGVKYSLHRNIGIALFALATLQIFAMFLRPKKDHKYRIYWNFYHHSVGYSVIILGIINVFKGLNILQPEKKWKTTYTTLIIILAGIAVLLEAITWIVVLRRKSRNSTKPNDGFHG